jgi:hypothetical protein
MMAVHSVDEGAEAAEVAGTHTEQFAFGTHGVELDLGGMPAPLPSGASCEAQVQSILAGAADVHRCACSGTELGMVCCDSHGGLRSLLKTQVLVPRCDRG